MSARKNKQLVAYVEDMVFRAVERLTLREGKSNSDYIRGLAIADLKQKGLLTDAMLAELV